MTEISELVYINLPGPEGPSPGISGGELLHGFLAELYRALSPEIKSYVSALYNISGTAIIMECGAAARAQRSAALTEAR